MSVLTVERIFVVCFPDGPGGVQIAFGVNDDRSLVHLSGPVPNEDEWAVAQDGLRDRDRLALPG